MLDFSFHRRKADIECTGRGGYIAPMPRQSASQHATLRPGQVIRTIFEKIRHATSVIDHGFGQAEGCPGNLRRTDDYVIPVNGQQCRAAAPPTDNIRRLPNA